MVDGGTRPSEVRDLPQPLLEKVVSKPISFSDIVQGKSSSTQSAIDQMGLLNSNKFLDPSSLPSKTSSDHHGKPSITFTTSEKLQMVEKLKWVLVGKFSHGRPTMAAIKAFFKDVELQGNVNFAFADSKHIFIECSGYLDYYLIWMHLVWNINGYKMRMFKWNSSFSALVESPIAPVWIRIEGLALYMFDEITLLSIASTIGKPIKVDARNVNRTCLSSARICIELDVSKPLIDAIWISIVDEKTGAPIEGRWAQVFYDVVPQFCPECSHIGHQSANCKRKKEGLSGAHQSNLDSTKSVLPTTVVHWQGAQISHKKVWKQIGIRQTVQFGLTESIVNDAKGFYVGECSNNCPTSSLSGSKQIWETKLKGTEQCLISDEVPSLYSQNSLPSLQLDKKALSAIDMENAAAPTEQIAGTLECAESEQQQELEQHYSSAIKPVRSDFSEQQTSEEGSTQNTSAEQKVAQPGGSLVQQKTQKCSSVLSSSVVESDEEWTTVVRSKKKGRTKSGNKTQSPTSQAYVTGMRREEIIDKHEAIVAPILVQEFDVTANTHQIVSTGTERLLNIKRTWAEEVEAEKEDTIEQIYNENVTRSKVAVNNKSTKGSILSAKLNKFRNLKYCDELDKGKRNKLRRSSSIPPNIVATIKVLDVSKENTDLPIDFDQIFLDPEENEYSWDDIRSKHLVASCRSVSPSGRTSSKLSSLKKKVELVYYLEDKAWLWDKANYEESRLKRTTRSTRPNLNTPAHKDDHSQSAPQASRRGRGRNRGVNQRKHGKGPF